MYQKERTEKIMGILQKYGYVTVKFLVEELHYSNATINRDLNLLESSGRIIRSYGGAELVENTMVPLEFRYHKMKTAKKHIAKRAADFIQNGDVVFIDGSTTSEAMGGFLTEKKNITVITNNMTLAADLSEYGINAVCTGGCVTEAPSMLGGYEAVHTAMRYKTDKMFFSTAGFGDDGTIGVDGLYELVYEAAIPNTKECYYLADSGKVNAEWEHNFADFGKVNAVISDYVFSDEVKKKYANTCFYEV